MCERFGFPDDCKLTEEKKWNDYVNSVSPNRSATEDYPRPDEERRSASNDQYRSRSRSRSPIERRHRGVDRDHRAGNWNRRDNYSSHKQRGSPPRRHANYDRQSSERRTTYTLQTRVRDTREWSRHACTTVAIRYIPRSVHEDDIRNELRDAKAAYVGIKMDFEQGPKGTTTGGRVCYVEFEGTREAIEWMSKHQGSLRIGREKMPMVYDHPDSADFSTGGSNNRRKNDNRSDERLEERRHKPLGEASETMIVRGMNLNTTEEGVRKAFQFITNFPIQEIRFIRDNVGKFRGFCFIKWKSTEDCTQVIEYLRNAKPSFHIDNTHVQLDYSTPAYVWSAKQAKIESGKQTSSTSAAAAAAIEAAQWSRGDSLQQHQRGASNVAAASAHQYPVTPKMPQAQSAAVPQTRQTIVYPTPNPDEFQLDVTSGYYYDCNTQLYYDKVSKYFYNNISQKYLYWDANTRNYIAVNAADQAVQQEKRAEAKEQKDKEQKKKKATKLAKDMERWAKAQNKKKEEYKKSMEDTPRVMAVAQETTRKESASADTVFLLLNKEPAEAERLQNLNAVYNMNNVTKDLTAAPLFKMLDTSVPAAAPKPTRGNKPVGLVSYQHGSDSDDDDADENGNEAEVIDWVKLVCNLCRRTFKTKEVLDKHISSSKLHKTNLLKRNVGVGQATVVPPSAVPAQQQHKYRDRAAERRNKFGVEKPGPTKVEASARVASVPYEQPTKDGLGGDNKGNQMLKSMGWKQGNGLGKTQSGRVDPIEVQQRSRGAGLGMKGATYRQDGTESYRTMSNKITQARYKDSE